MGQIVPKRGHKVTQYNNGKLCSPYSCVVASGKVLYSGHES